MRNVSKQTVIFDKTEVKIHWATFLLNLKDYAREHFCRSGQMTEEEVIKRVICDDPDVAFFIDDHGRMWLNEVSVDVEIDMNVKQND